MYIDSSLRNNKQMNTVSSTAKHPPTSTHTHTLTHIHSTHTHTHTQHTHTYINTHTCTKHTHSCTHTCTHTPSHRHMLTSSVSKGTKWKGLGGVKGWG